MGSVSATVCCTMRDLRSLWEMDMEEGSATKLVRIVALANALEEEENITTSAVYVVHNGRLVMAHDVRQVLNDINVRLGVLRWIVNATSAGIVIVLWVLWIVLTRLS